MIPRVRLTYVQGLSSAHEDLNHPREVDLTTDGQSLIVAPAASSRPLTKLPLAAVEPVAVEPEGGPMTATTKSVLGMVGTESVLVLRVHAAPGVAAAVVEQPIVFVDPQHGDVAAKLGAVQDILRPRTPDEMARLERGERRRSVYYAIGFILAVVAVIAVTVLLMLAVFAPQPRQGIGPLGPLPAPYAPVAVAV